MFSKRNIVLFCLFGQLLTLTSCGLNVGEKPLQDQPFTLKSGGFSCLTKISETIDQFLAGHLAKRDIQRFLHCMRFSFESFGSYVRGVEAHNFTPDEIRSFLHEYFIKDRRVSDELLHEFMVIKTVLVGGAVDKISRKDLVQAIDMLSFIEEQALLLQPYMKVYGFDALTLSGVNLSEDDNELNRAAHILRQVATNLGRRLGRASGDYTVANLEAFIREFRSFTGWEKTFTGSKSTKDWVRFFSAYKSLITGSEEEIVGPRDWELLFRSSAEWFTVHLFAQNINKYPSWMYGSGLETVVGLGDKVTRLLQDLVDRQPDKVLSHARLERFIESLSPVGLMPSIREVDSGNKYPLRSEGVIKAVHAFLDRILGDQQIPWRERPSNGLGRTVIAEMAAEFSRWVDIQRFLASVFDPGVRGGLDVTKRLESLAERLGPVGASEEMLRLFKQKPQSDSAEKVVRFIEQNLRPLFRPGEWQVFITERDQLESHNVVHGFHNLSIMNLVRAVATMAMRGYGSYKGDGGAFSAGMTENELQALYEDFREVGIDIKIMDPRTSQAGVRAFREANLFTYVGNGWARASRVKNPMEAMMTLAESIEYGSILLSGGQLGASLYRGLMSVDHGVCRAQSQDAPLSVHGYKMIERNCFRTRFVDTLLPLLTTMPTMKKEIEKRSLSDRVELADSVTSAIYSPVWSNKDYLEWNEITTLSVVMHYTELIMTRYNKNLDTILDTAEVWAAYEIFKEYMLLLAGLKCRQMVDEMKNPYQKNPVLRKITDWGGDSERAKLAKRWYSYVQDLLKTKGCDELPNQVGAVLFAHLIKEGKVPTSLTEVNYAPKLPLVGVKFEVDRTSLLKVFAALIKANAEATAAPPIPNSVN